jgi:hypothetical protein
MENTLTVKVHLKNWCEGIMEGISVGQQKKSNAIYAINMHTKTYKYCTAVMLVVKRITAPKVSTHVH